MKRAFFALALTVLAQPAWAGGKIVATTITPPVQLAAKAVWNSPKCLPVAAPPWTVFVMTAGAANVTIQRFLDAGCTRPAGVTAPLPTLTLVKSAACPSGSLCGDLGGSGDQIAVAVKVSVADTSGAANWVLDAELFADPPAPPPAAADPQFAPAVGPLSR